MKKLILATLLISPFLLVAQPKLVKPISASTNFTNLNNTFLFYTSSDSLWKTDGTTSTFVKDGLTSPTYFKAVKNNLYFLNNSNDFWVYNNLDNSFTKLKSFESIYYLNTINDVLFFVGNDGTTGRELWKTDGTVEGTVLVKDINPGAANGFPDFIPFPQNKSLTAYNAPVLNNEIYFAATNGNNGIEPWKSNGTDAGTVMIKDLNPTGNSNPRDFAVSQNAVFFITQDADLTFFLYKTDGTATGTTIMKEFTTEFCQCDVSEIITIHNLRDINNTLYFTVQLYPTGSELIGKSNGTVTGTSIDNSVNAIVWDIQKVDTKIIFNIINDAPHQVIGELNTSNLSVANKYETKFYTTDFAWVPFTFVDSLIYFADWYGTETTNLELCYFNTKTEKVTFIKDKFPNLSFSNPSDADHYHFSVVNKDVYFTSNGKLWVIQGDDSQITSISNGNNSYFNVYPNPFEDVIKINSPDPNDVFSITLIDAIGKSHYELTSQSSTVDLSSLNLQKGVYLVKIKNQNNKEQLIRILKK